MIVSGKIELDYCVFARGNTPAKPMFIHWEQQLRQWYPSYMLTCNELTQLILIVEESQQSALLKKGVSISITSDGLAVVIKKQTIELALPDSTSTFQEVADELCRLTEEIECKHKDCLVTSRMVITSFVNQFIAV